MGLLHRVAWDHILLRHHTVQTWRTQLQPVIVVASVEDSETEAGEAGAVATGVRLAKAFFIRFSTPTLCSLVMPGERPNPSMERPTLILQECTGAAGSTLPLILLTSMSLV